MHSINILFLLAFLYFHAKVLRAEDISLQFTDENGQKYIQEIIDLGNDTVQPGDSSNEPFLQRFQSRLRSKRSNSNLQTIETYVITDYSVYKKWLGLSNGDATKALKAIKFHLAHVFTGVNEVYSNIRSAAYRFEVKVTGISIKTKPEESPYTEKIKNAKGQLNLVTAFDSLAQWVKDNQNKLPNYDVAVVFTGYPGKGPVGRAGLRSACSRGVVLVRERGVLGNILTTAHEIGHTLSAEHDGHGNNCPLNGGYIMEAQAGVDSHPNADKFSTCSVNFLENFVKKMDLRKTNCFQERVDPAVDYVDLSADAAVKPGTLYDLNQQCSQIYGQGYTYCSSGGNTHKDICRMTSCKGGLSESCIRSGSTRALDGTICGNRQWCVGGQCVADKEAPENDGYCLHGEVDKFNLNGVDTKCVKIDRTSCYGEGIHNLCCKTCASLDSGIIGCSFGDRAGNCKEILTLGTHNCRKSDIKKACCETCKDF